MPVREEIHKSCKLLASSLEPSLSADLCAEGGNLGEGGALIR
jgi:hypothetical protein